MEVEIDRFPELSLFFRADDMTSPAAEALDVAYWRGELAPAVVLIDADARALTPLWRIRWFDPLVQAEITGPAGCVRGKLLGNALPEYQAEVKAQAQAKEAANGEPAAPEAESPSPPAPTTYVFEPEDDVWFDAMLGALMGGDRAAWENGEEGRACKLCDPQSELPWEEMRRFLAAAARAGKIPEEKAGPLIEELHRQERADAEWEAKEDAARERRRRSDEAYKRSPEYLRDCAWEAEYARMSRQEQHEVNMWQLARDWASDTGRPHWEYNPFR